MKKVKNKMTGKKHSNSIKVAGLLMMVLLLFSGCKPSIISLDPDRGEIGSFVTINGSWFGKTAAENTVKFANATVPIADISVISTSQLRVRVPAEATTGLVSVATGKGTAYSKMNFIISGESKWTFMVYLDADNNLESAGIDDFLEMASVGTKNGVNILIQMDRIDGYEGGYGNWTGTRRFLVGTGNTPSSTPLQDMGEQNMGDPRVLQDFIEWAITNYPAEHYALSIWNHGDGWRKSVRSIDSLVALRRAGNQESLVRAVASDNTDGDILYMREVQEALDNARQALEDGSSSVKIDVVGFDACLMGMVEVAYALRNSIDYMVGSEETEPGDGWPYNTILTDLTNTPDMTPDNLAGTIVTRYGDSYPGEVTQAAYDISKLEELALKIDNFTVAANTEWAALKTARNNSRQYHACSYSCWGTDLWDFADKAYINCTSVNIKNAAAELKNSINNFVIEEFHNPDMAGSHGVAIYFPPDLASFNSDPQHRGYEESNTFMPVDFVLLHQFDNWLQQYFANIP